MAALALPRDQPILSGTVPAGESFVSLKARFGNERKQ